MPYDLTSPLVIGISSRALFDLEAENRIFEAQGVAAYEAWQLAHEQDVLGKGFAGLSHILCKVYNVVQSRAKYE